MVVSDKMGEQQYLSRAGILLLVVFVLISACRNQETDISRETAYYLHEASGPTEELEQMFTSLQASPHTPETRFIYTQQIMQILYQHKNLNLLNLFLTDQAATYPQDQYNAYYLLRVAMNYMETGFEEFAVPYFERILRNCPDLLIPGRETSIHLLCLKNLADLVEIPEQRVEYLKELLSRFQDKIDTGYTYYQLALTYEKLGEWDLVYQAYKNYLKYPDTIIPDAPNAYQQVSSRLAFHEYPNKNWTFESLDDLIGRIKYALYHRLPQNLARYRAKVNFFTVSWEQDRNPENTEFITHLNSFMDRGLHYMGEVDIISNQQEAYFRTWGWSYRIRIWYLYFRRVDYLADPEIHGNWEWGGIYFGERPFSNSENE